MSEDSIIKVDESGLVRWLFAVSPARRVLLPELRIPPGTFSFFGVPQDGYPGDVDVLVVDPLRPDRATAIECKRVKVDAAAFDTLLPNKLQAVAAGVKQANALRRLGFHRSLLLVLIASETHERTEYNFSGRTLSAELLAVIRRFPKRDQLDEAVGIAFVEITQPTAKHGFLAAGVGAKLVRDPVPQLQATALTQRVRELAKTIPNAYERRAPNKRLQQTPQTRVVCCRVASPRQHL